MTDAYMWPVVAASLLGTVANIYRRRWCFVLWAATNVTWTVYDIYKTAYPQAVLMAVYFCLAIWGWFSWRAKR